MLFTNARVLLPIAAASLCSLWWVADEESSPGGAIAQEVTPPGLRPLPAEKDVPELALLMGDLQRLTHKMALSAHEGNAELAAFYMHESLEQLQNIQQQSPVYEDQPIALWIDRVALPAYEPFKEAVNVQPVDRGRMLSALDGVIASCNQCHNNAKHPLIRITRGTEANPFNQSFKPLAP